MKNRVRQESPIATMSEPSPSNPSDNDVVGSPAPATSGRRREGNDSLWKRARRTLGTSSLTFLQPQSRPPRKSPFLCLSSSSVSVDSVIISSYSGSAGQIGRNRLSYRICLYRFVSSIGSFGVLVLVWFKLEMDRSDVKIVSSSEPPTV